jgi:hypothetical protein
VIEDHRSITSSNVSQAVPLGTCVETNFFIKDASEVLKVSRRRRASAETAGKEKRGVRESG